MKFLAMESDTKQMPKPKELRHAMEDLTNEYVARFLHQGEGASFWQGTVGPSDALVMPSGWAWGEKISGHDVIGVKMSFFTGADMTTFEWFQSLTLAQGKPLPALQAVNDLLTLAS